MSRLRYLFWAVAFVALFLDVVTASGVDRFTFAGWVITAVIFSCNAHMNRVDAKFWHDAWLHDRNCPRANDKER